MASWTDIIPKFNPYIQQLPVDAMVKVGMEKQKRYDEGLQKIQTQIEQVAGLDVIRDVDKKYLQSKLNELGNNLRSVAAGDFSNFQLVNSVGGMTKQIVKDGNVQNAVSSTAWYRKQKERIQKDIDEGKSSPDNIYKFNKQANDWLNSDDVSKTFNASYTPYFDIFKFAKETFDAVAPDGYSFDQIYQMGADGKPVKDKDGNLIYSTTMTRLEREGRFPKKVQETLSQIFSDARVSQQLAISGEYNYRNYDEASLAKRVLVQRDNLINDYEEKLAELNIKKKSGEDVQDQIDAVQQRLENVKLSYQTYAEVAKTNPDLVRGKLYEDDVFSRYSTMFGKITTKQQVLDNPAWKAQFEMQKEANAQSRWAQTEARQRREFKETKDIEREKMIQAWNIAVLNASVKGGKGGGKGFGIPEDTSKFTQANQFSDVDVLFLAENDYQKAADSFSNNSVGIVWDNGFDDIPGNQKRLSDLVKSGKSPEEAKYTIMKELADKRGIPIEEFLVQYTNKVVTNYNKITPEEKQKNPILVTQYNDFKNSLKNFQAQKNIKKEIDSQVEAIYGSDFSKNVALKDIKDQKIKVLGKEYELSKNDIYDLAVYLKGRLSVLGEYGGVDEGVRRASSAALSRLKLKGKEELAEELINQRFGERVYFGGPITGAVDLVRNIGGVRNLYKNIRYASDSTDPFNQVDKVFELINDDKFAGILKAKADVIKKNYNISPNLQTELFTGDSETDKELLYMIKGYAGGYSTKKGGKINLSGDFDTFSTELAKAKDPNDISLSVQPTIGADGNVVVEVVAYDNNNLSRAGGMTLQPDEANKLGIDINTLYESPEVLTLRNQINFNGGKSSNGDPSKRETYIQGDAYFDESDFPQLKNSKISAKGNVVKVKGKYFPYIYVTDGTTEKIRPLEGSPSLGAAVSALLSTNPTFAKMILTER